MTKNPLINALLAVLYIALVASVAFYTSQFTHSILDNTVVAPMAAMSLLTFSVAVMAYLFFYQPFRLYFDNKREAAVKLFLHTLGAFAIITILIVAAIFFFSGAGA